MQFIAVIIHKRSAFFFQQRQRARKRNGQRQARKHAQARRGDFKKLHHLFHSHLGSHQTTRISPFDTFNEPCHVLVIESDKLVCTITNDS